MQRRNVVDMRRQARAGNGAAGSAAVGSGVLDLVSAAGDGSPAFAVSVSRRLRDAYTGPLLRLRRGVNGVTNSGEQDIYPLEDGTLDVDEIVLFCGALRGYVVRVYDQSGNGRDYFRSTLAYQPLIYHPTYGIARHVSGVPAWYQAAFYVLEQTDHGLSGATAVTLAFDATRDREIDNAYGSNLIAYLSGSSHFSARLCWYPQARAGAAGIKSKMYDRYTSDTSGYVYTLGAGVAISAVNIYQNGVLLGGKPFQYGPSDTSTSTTINLSGASFWGASNAIASGAFRGCLSTLIAWPVVLSSEGRAAVDAFMAMHDDGVQDWTGSPAVVMAGQSNVEMFTYDLAPVTAYPWDTRVDGRWWSQAGFSGSSTAQWQQGVLTEGMMIPFSEAVKLAQRADPSQPLSFLWIQGEANAAPGMTAAHAAEEAQLVADLETVLGRPFLWIDVLLGVNSGSGTPEGRASVNADKVALAASRGVYGATIDPDGLAGSYGEGPNGVHFNQTKMNAIYVAAEALIDTYEAGWPYP